MATLIRDWIEQAAACHGADLYLADARGPAALSYAGLLDTVTDVERRLDAAGLPPGARIVVRLGEPVEYATALVAIVAAGRVAVPLDPAAPDTDVARVLGVARPAAVVYRVDVAPGGDEPGLTGEATGPFDQIEFDFDVIDDVDPDSAEPRPPATAGGGIFLCTSGTTGTPKGILLREQQLAHVASSVVDCHRLGRGRPRLLLAAPLPRQRRGGRRARHPPGGGVPRARPQVQQARLLAADQRPAGITWINAVPAIISILAIEPPADRPAALRFVRSASAPLPLASLERFESALGVPVVETYGMTEAASMITANPVDGPRKPGSAGRPASVPGPGRAPRRRSAPRRARSAGCRSGARA